MVRKGSGTPNTLLTQPGETSHSPHVPNTSQNAEWRGRSKGDSCTGEPGTFWVGVWHPKFHQRMLFLISDQSAKQHKLEAKSSLDRQFTPENSLCVPFTRAGYTGSVRFFSRMGRNGPLSCLKSVRLRCPPQGGGRSRRWERSVLEELGCFASTQRLEPIPASRLSCEELPQAFGSRVASSSRLGNPGAGGAQTVIWRCTCTFWRASGSHSGRWEARLRNPKSK